MNPTRTRTSTRSRRGTRSRGPHSSGPRLAVHSEGDVAVLEVRRTPQPCDIGVLRELARAPGFRDRAAQTRRFVVDLTSLRVGLGASAVSALIALAYDVHELARGRLEILVDRDAPALGASGLLGMEELVDLRTC